MRLLDKNNLGLAITFPLIAAVSYAQTYPLKPDLCPQEATLESHRLEYTDSGLVLLWLDNSVANVGRGALHLLGGDTLSTEPETVVEALQRYEVSAGVYDSVKVGEWDYDSRPGHDHWHYDGFAAYSVHEYVNDSTIGDSLAGGGKVGFCLIDAIEHDPVDCCCPSAEGTPPDSAIFTGGQCEDLAQGQGISVGWVDVYGMVLEGQFVNVTDVANGEYWLRSVVDPFDSLRQTDQSNDTAKVKVQIISEVDRYEKNNSKASVDTMRVGKPNGSKLSTCGMPHLIENLNIHQHWDWETTVWTPDEDWFKFRLPQSTDSTHYAQIDFEHDLGDLKMQLLDSAGDTLRVSSTASDSEYISLDSLGPGWYYVRVLGEPKGISDPPENFHINYDYSLTLNAPAIDTCGDVNDDGIVSVADILHFNANCFYNSLACTHLADVDGNCPLWCNADLWYLIDYFFSSGPPLDCTCE